MACASEASEGAQPTATLLALGDSYTIGEGVSPEVRWPVRLAARLGEEGVAIADPEIVARTGWSTDELSAALDRKPPARQSYTIVTLLIGVNDQYRGRSADDYRPRFRRLLERGIELASGEPRCVLVVSIPDWGATPFAEGEDRGRIAAEIDRFNSINESETKRRSATYVEVTEISRRARVDESLIASDGLHPSPKMYAAWVERAIAAARACLAAR